MNKEPVIIEDEIKEVAEKTATSLALAINFMFGPAPEIENNLIEMTKAQGLPGQETLKKYPLIILFTDVPEDLGNANGYYGTVTIPSLVIACISDNKLKAPQRLEQNFKPILIPIFEELKRQLARHSAFIVGSPENLRMKKWNRYFWGKQKFGTTLNDYVDAIEIQNLVLTLNNPKCQR